MLEIIGLLVGLAVGLLFPWTIPSQYSLYAATGLLAALDSALGGLRARVEGDFKLDVAPSATPSSRCSSPGWAAIWGSPCTWRRWWCSERECSKTLRKSGGNY